MSTIRALASLLMLAVVALAGQDRGAPPSADQAPLVFKVEVNYVEIDVTVTDAQGRPVEDLSREDFEVTEEGKSQELTSFARVQIPVERPDPPLFRATAVEPDVRSNRREFDGRVFVLLLDDLHTSFTRTPRVRAAAGRFIERHVGANDLVAVVHTSGTTSGDQEFTMQRALMLGAVNAFAGRRLPSEALERLGGGGAAAAGSDAERAHRARNLLNSVRGVAEYLTGIRGRRKAVVLFSEGIDYDVTNPIANQYGSDIINAMQGAVAAATRGNVTFYTVDPRGLSGVDEAMEVGSLPADQPGALSALGEGLRRSQDSLRVLAEGTGGLAVINRNDYDDAFERIVRDNSSYYVLGYYSENTRRDGRFRAVDVRVRRPGALVRARKGYTAARGNPAPPRNAPPGAASAELREAISSPIPVSALGITASAIPFRGGAKNASVLLVLEVDGRTFRFTERDGKPATELEIVALPIDARGNFREGVRDLVVLTPRPDTQDKLVANGVRLLRRLELPPGRHQLKLGARESGSGAAGSLTLDVDVPDFAKGPISMSGLVLSTTSATEVLTANPDEGLKDVLPTAPTVRRAFDPGDELSLYTEVYDDLRPAHRVEIKTLAIAEDGRAVYAHTDERRSEELRARGDGFGHARTIPLKDFPPGRYVLRVEARALVSDATPVSRELEFTIR
ncbi:hypothetical protein BH24ACI4_BH24ACI4_08480 [soil metagenome]